MLDTLVGKAKDAYKKGLLWLVKKTASDILPKAPKVPHEPDVHVPHSGDLGSKLPGLHHGHSHHDKSEEK